MEAPLVAMRNINKVFPPGIAAEDHVDLEVFRGTIHSVVGENGAGKSTLMKILYGLIPADSGSIMLAGKRAVISSPRAALAHGIGMVHQEFMLIPSYNVYENVILGAEPAGPLVGRLDAKEARARVDRLIADFNFALPAETRIRDLSVAAQQKVEILKLLYRNANILILDEPTAVLTPQEIGELFERLLQFKKDGKTILFISHKLDEVLSISDTITVMRRGKVVVTVRNRDITKEDLAKLMVGRDVVLSVSKKAASPGDPVLAVKGLSVENNFRHTAVQEANLTVHRGEIVGIAGVEGNGQKELIEAVVGLRPVMSGAVLVGAADVTRRSIAERREAGLCYVPQDRKGAGSAQAGTLEQNSIMGHHLTGRVSGRRRWLLNLRKAREFSEGVISRFSVVSSGPQSQFRSLSGGNQQKLILGRELSFDAPLVVLDQPTRGLDVGSIEFVHRTIVAARDDGAGILMVSADLDEVMSLSDRILVMYRGEIVAELDPKRATREQIGIYMLGGRAAGTGTASVGTAEGVAERGA